MRRRGGRIPQRASLPGPSALSEEWLLEEKAVCTVYTFTTPMEDLVALAGAGEGTPARSTWVEPILASGLVSNMQA